MQKHSNYLAILPWSQMCRIINARFGREIGSILYFEGLLRALFNACYRKKMQYDDILEYISIEIRTREKKKPANR